jgi:hypothetical protein
MIRHFRIGRSERNHFLGSVRPPCSEVLPSFSTKDQHTISQHGMNIAADEMFLRNILNKEWRQ